MSDVNKKVEEIAAAAGRTMADASAVSNAEVQKRGPAVVAFIKRWWWVGALVIAALVYAGTR